MTVSRVETLVIGAGSWGTALASLLARNGQPTCLWGRDEARMAQIARTRCNDKYLPGIQLPEQLRVSADLEASLAWAHDVLIAVPSQVFRTMLSEMASHLKPAARLAWATKGFEPATGALLHAVAHEVIGSRRAMAVLSGPTFAAEVAKGLPTALTVAATTADFADDLAARLHNDFFRAYTSADIAGVEVGGAVKNVLAIAAGVSDGLDYGANARAALVTRGLTEIMRLGVALGGQRETFMGLAGLGDLVLTCTDNQSRNRRFGLALGRGETVDAAHAAIGQVVEGMHAAAEVQRLAARLKIEMPISEQVFQIIHNGRSAREAVSLLLHREQKPEHF